MCFVECLVNPYTLKYWMYIYTKIMLYQLIVLWPQKPQNYLDSIATVIWGEDKLVILPKDRVNKEFIDYRHCFTRHWQIEHKAMTIS